MAIPINIEELLRQRVVESTRIEYKKDWNPNAIIHTICAFANDIDNVGGGYIIVGVEEENGLPIFPIRGIDDSKIDKILNELIGYCHCIEPLYNPVVETVLFEGKKIIVIWVPGGYGRPYKASKDIFVDKSNKLYYIRKFSSTIVASNDEEKQLFYVATDIPFDDRPNLAAEVNDLDISLMRKHLKEIDSSLYEISLKSDIVKIAKDMKLVAGPKEHLKPLNVGLLMFSEQPERFFKYARIEVVDLPDATGTKMTEKVFTGPIQKQLKDALLFIKNYALKEVIIKNSNKEEADRFSNYPFAAIEEILANAVYHRSYQVNEPITVKITPESITVTSFPGFDISITDEDILNFNITSPMYRNRRIGDFLKELHLIEGRNTGYPTILKSLKENGSDYPIIKMDANRNYLSVTLKVHPYFQTKNLKDTKKQEYQERILKELAQKPLSMTEISLALGYKSISKKLSSTLEEMVKMEILVKIIQDRSIKYCIYPY